MPSLSPMQEAPKPNGAAHRIGTDSDPVRFSKLLCRQCGARPTVMLLDRKGREIGHYCRSCASAAIQATIDRDMAQARAEQPPGYLETSIDNLRLSRKAVVILTRAGARTLGDVCRLSEPHLLREPEVGRVTVAEIKNVLRTFGLALRREVYRSRAVGC